MMPKSDVVRYAGQHPSTTTLLPSGKLRFTQTGMEFPAHADTKTLKVYARGRAYRRALVKKMNEGYDFEQHLPYIVPHKYRDKKHFLYCTLTNKTLPRQKDVVLNHTNGRRFKRRYEEAEKERKKTETRIEKQEKKAVAMMKSTDPLLGGKQAEGRDDDIMRNGHVQDVLAGLLSSDSESEQEDVEMGDAENAESKTADVSEEEQDGFQKVDQRNGENLEPMADNSSQEELQRHDTRSHKTHGKRSPSGVQRTLIRAATGTSSERTPSSVKARAFASKKRRRPKTPIPKKMRQARQKRKAEGTATVEDDD
ncbi:unnamed protein product [Agarophyton chilense]